MHAGGVDGLRTRYVDALVDADVRAARGVLDDALAAGIPVRRLYLELLQPALYEIGRRWADGELSVAQEHLATATTETLMAQLSERFADPRRPVRERTVVVACADGELHQVGSRMVADFLAADGWRVLYLGALTPPDELARLVADHGAAVVALSAALSERLDGVRAAVRSLRALDPQPLVLVGGQAVGGQEEASALGADAYAAGPAEAVDLLADRFPAAA